MVDMMIMNIEKTIAKALDINNIINFVMALWGCELDESKSLNE